MPLPSTTGYYPDLPRGTWSRQVSGVCSTGLGLMKPGLGSVGPPGFLCPRVLTCRTLELGEDGLSLGVTLPTLLQKVAQVSDPCPPYLQQLPGTQFQPKRSRGRLQEDGASPGQVVVRAPDQGLRGGEPFLPRRFPGGLCLADLGLST